MLLARDAGIRRLAGEILLVQAATTIAIAAVCALFWGRIVALSALAGGTTGLIAEAAPGLRSIRTDQRP